MREGCLPFVGPSCTCLNNVGYNSGNQQYSQLGHRIMVNISYSKFYLILRVLVFLSYLFNIHEFLKIKIEKAKKL